MHTKQTHTIKAAHQFVTYCVHDAVGLPSLPCIYWWYEKRCIGQIDGRSGRIIINISIDNRAAVHGPRTESAPEDPKRPANGKEQAIGARELRLILVPCGEFEG